MSGRLGKQAEKVKSFVQKILDGTDVTIKFRDERLTTVAAERALISADVNRKKRKQVIDMVAATYILQGYLDSQIK